VGAVGALTGWAVRHVDGPVERMTIDARFAVRGHRAPSPKLTIVAFDNKTLRQLNIRPPIPRAIHARVVDRLDLAGASVVAFDYSLEQPSGDERQDRALVVALLNARRAVVSVAAPAAGGDLADLAGFVRFEDTGVLPGYTPLQLDAQGVVRRIRLGSRRRGRSCADASRSQRAR
jgi:CHASE2 domain-containing sensor protein